MGGQPNHHVFAATTPNIGTTTLALRHAMRLASEPGRRVVYACLNLKSSRVHTYVGLQPSVPFDQLLPDIQARCLTDERLAAALQPPVRGLPQFRILCGNMQRECAESVDASDIAYLLERVASDVDEIVIDVSAYLDNAATLHCLTQPWKRYCVTTNAVQHFAHDYRAGIGRLQTMYRLPIQFNQIYVRIMPGEPYTIQQISKVMGIGDVEACPQVSGLGEALRKGRYLDAIAMQREAA